jgi:hypothetical protein
MHLYNKEDLAKLKDSKPIQITAHTHECIVPVVYSGMVNRFLESKGVHLPLTHHQLADMKREAGTPGYAKGTKDLKKKGKKGKGKAKAGHVSQTVVVNVSRPVRAAAKPSGAKNLYDQLRPSNYAMIRSVSSAPPQVHPVIDYAKEAREAKVKETEALEHYKKEIATRTKQMEQLQATMETVLSKKDPLYTSPKQIPLRANDFDQVPPDIMKREHERALQRHLDREVGKTMKLAKKLAKKKEEEEKAKATLPALTPAVSAQSAVSAQPAVSTQQAAQQAITSAKKRGRPKMKIIQEPAQQP